jgi:transposase InsO family protein
MTHEQTLSNSSLGYRKMKCLLTNEYNIKIGKNKVLKLMRENHLLALIRRGKPKYQIRAKENIICNNILARNFHTNTAKKKIAIDITYIPIPNSMVYMIVALDLYNNEVLEYILSQKPDSMLSIELIKRLRKKYQVEGMMLHSDQGIHFTNNEYVALLHKSGIKQSMSRKGNCWDNAVIESFFGHFKCECIKLQRKALKNFANVGEVVGDYITFYNNRRPQMRLGGLSPVKYRLMQEKR